MKEKGTLSAVILAAGEGIRQRANGDCKPLVSLLGLTLIERVILTAKNTGIEHFHIIVGYKADKIKKFIGDGHKYGVTIEYILNDEWKRGNGVSVLKAKSRMHGPFALFMADHLFEESILQKLQESTIGKDECTLCVDRNGRNYLNLEDATKVITENGKIIDIGKRLKRYDAIDTGIFLCTPVIFDVLRESIRGGDETLSGGIKILANRGRMNSLDISQGFWFDVDDPKDLKNAESHLCKQLKKKTDGPVSRFINRPISIRITRWLLKTRMKPNQISLLSFFIGILGGLFFSMGNNINLVIGGLLVQLSSVIDGCDGEVARLKFLATNFGGWFDAVLDRYADALIILGMIYGHWTMHNDIMVWLVGFAALVGSFMNSYTAHKYDSFLKGQTRPEVRLGRDVRMFIILVGALFNQVFITLSVLAVLTNFESIRRVLILRNELD